MEKTLAILLPILLAAAPGRAEDRPWKDQAELSFVSTSGNSESTTLGAKNAFSYAFDASELGLDASALVVKSGGVKTAERFDAEERFKRSFSESLYGYERFGWTRDRFAGVRGRIDLNAGAGAKLIDRKPHALSAEVGAGHVWEERLAGPDRKFPSGRAYLEYLFAFADGAEFSQDAELTADFEEPDNYRLKSETALAAPLSKRISLKASFEWKRAGLPPPGFERDDTTTSLSLLIKI